MEGRIEVAGVEGDRAGPEVAGGSWARPKAAGCGRGRVWLDEEWWGWGKGGRGRCGAPSPPSPHPVIVDEQFASLLEKCFHNFLLFLF